LSEACGKELKRENFKKPVRPKESISKGLAAYRNGAGQGTDDRRGRVMAMGHDPTLDELTDLLKSQVKRQYDNHRV